MSKLDKAIYPLLPNSQWLLSDEAKEVEQNIKNLFKELIGKDETYVPTAPHAHDDLLQRNQMRQQLRQKVDEL